MRNIGGIYNMKNLIEHNREMFKVIEKWLLKKTEQRKKDAEIICYKCGEKMLYDGNLRHRVGVFYDINVICPNQLCKATGVKIVRSIVHLEKIRDLLK